MKKFQKPTPEVLKQNLTPLQYKVTQEEGTEQPFKNEYWDLKQDGIYVDVVSGEPLFSSHDKFDSGTGWPSFSKPLEAENIVTHEDGKLFMKRVEVRSKKGDSHLGHVFNDGPKPTGQRYCMNSASLKFIPADKLQEAGYAEYAQLFAAPKNTVKEVATFAGGCFWGVEELFRQLPGVLDTEVGYSGGATLAPVYSQVKQGNTGHAEAIQITYDASRLSYEDLLLFFFSIHDPTTENRQGNDLGSQYRSAIFFHGPEQKEIAERVKKEAQSKWGQPIVTEIVAAKEFYKAEDYHQDYLQKTPDGYTCHFIRYDAFKDRKK